MSVALVWFRQDLRCQDNPALAAACQAHETIIPVYIADPIPKNTVGEAQGWWLHHSLSALKSELRQHGLDLCLRHGVILPQLLQLIEQYNVDTVYWNRCYEPQSISRDKTIKEALKQLGLKVLSFNGSLLLEPWEIVTRNQSYFKVFTPFWRQCLQQITIPPAITISKWPSCPAFISDELSEWQLLPNKPNWASEFSHYWEPGEKGALAKLDLFIDEHLANYTHGRDIPSQDATSKLSPHLHFGEISPWQIWRAVRQETKHLAAIEKFLTELGWREFSYHLLYHFPNLASTNFKMSFDHFLWENNQDALKKWQQGMTGFPIVDAGMRELWRTGYMHNRVRMIVASFLTKDLLIDWRLGAAWFLNTLVDADLANNSASWQWVAGCGADAAPYFRIFNPVLQGEKFDAQGDYIRQWVPELAKVSAQWIHKPWEASNSLGVVLGKDYPFPIVDHADARKQALMRYQLLKEQD